MAENIAAETLWTHLSSVTEELAKLKQENEELKQRLEHTEELFENEQKMRLSAKESAGEVKEDAYPEEEMNIKVCLRHDEDSVLSPVDELASLRDEIK